MRGASSSFGVPFAIFFLVTICMKWLSGACSTRQSENAQVHLTRGREDPVRQLALSSPSHPLGSDFTDRRSNHLFGGSVSKTKETNGSQIYSLSSFASAIHNLPGGALKGRLLPNDSDSPKTRLEFASGGRSKRTDQPT